MSYQVTIKEQADLEWDVGTPEEFGHTSPHNHVYPWNNNLDFMAGSMSPEESTIHGTLKDTQANINIYILGGVTFTAYANLEGKLKVAALAYGLARRNQNAIFLIGDPDAFNGIGSVPRDGAADQLHTFAHEIGHCLTGNGHPDDGGGPAPLIGLLPKDSVTDRLMVSGSRVRRPNHGDRLVKGEWDEAEKWIQKEISEGRMAP